MSTFVYTEGEGVKYSQNPVYVVCLMFILCSSSGEDMMMIEYITRTLRVNSRSKIVVLTYNLVRTPTLLVLHS